MPGSYPLDQPLEEDAARIRALLLGACLDGSCYELAIAIHRGTGLPLVGLWSDTASGDDRRPGTWRHAAVRSGDGFVDARGQVTAEEFGQPFGGMGPWDIRDITEANLLAVRPVREEGLASISKFAQAAWPQLPWGQGTYQVRAAAFLEELAELSRRHGLWIRSPYPAVRPMLAEGDGEEVGYRGEVAADGLSVAFDRSFIKD